MTAFKARSFLSLSIVGFILLSCQKNEREPRIETGIISNITYTSAKVDGDIIDIGSGILGYGHVWSTVGNLTVIDSSICETTNFGKADRTGLYQSELTGLEPGKWYYVKAYGITKKGNISYYVFGNEIQFVTNILDLPSLTTNNVTSITSTTAVSGGNVISDGGSHIIVRGLCLGTAANPTLNNNVIEVGSGTGAFANKFTGLTPNTLYYIRAYAINNIGIKYGDEVYFTTNDTVLYNPDLTYGKVADFEGNEYKTIQIGSQTWMAENLRSTNFIDGTSISLLLFNDQWSNARTPGYCWYNNEPKYKETLGALYNEYVITDTSKICPIGWHVPTYGEINDLILYLGGEEIGGAKMKETGVAHWSSPNIGASNECGFTALPGGQRHSIGQFFGIKNSGIWWVQDTYPSCFFIDFGYGYVHTIQSMSSGFGLSIRCIKDS